MRGAALAHRHCEERSDEAIQGPRVTPGLLRFARNDDGEAALQNAEGVNVFSNSMIFIA
jgi:hypothetical protein